MKKSLKFCKSKMGFTLVELVIVIAIVIILSVVSVPIYRGYVDKSKMSEAYALLGAILSAQKAYFSEYGGFYYSPNNVNGDWSSYYPALGIDARGNKYFTLFYTFSPSNHQKKHFFSAVRVPADFPQELRGDYANMFAMQYNITMGSIYTDGRWKNWGVNGLTD